MKKLSIVTPTFNSQRTIIEYLNAIFIQDYPHEFIDIIIADGGSSDDTLKIFQ